MYPSIIGVSPLFFLALALGLIGSASDMRSRRIPNWLTVGALVAAVVIRAVSPESVLMGLFGAAVGFGVALPLYLVRSMGAGDVKYLTAFGAILGVGRMVPALLLVAVAAGGLAVVAAVTTGRGPALLQSTVRLGLYGITLGRMGERRILSDAAAEVALTPIPLGVAIAVGCTLTLFV